MSPAPALRVRRRTPRPYYGRLAAFLLTVICVAADTGPLPWDVSAFQVAPRTGPAPAEVPAVEGVRALCFEGPPVRSQPTQVFAYLALPPAAPAGRKAPGIVLIHGAGGTASADWARLWAGRGYAAISIDTEGHLPVGRRPWPKNPGGGPRRGHVGDLKRPVELQWMYHAVADAMLAHSLLASLPEVDPRRIGICGISWGAVVACNVAGVDERLRFAVPVYGCGHISEPGDDGSWFVGAPAKGAENQPVDAGLVAAWRALWDPANFLPLARLPMLWIGGATDFAFTPAARQRSYRAAPGPRTLSLFPQFAHSETSGRQPEEIRVFADSIVQDGAPLLRVTGQGLQGRMAWAGYEARTPPRSAALWFTRETGRWQERRWESVPAEIAPDRVSAVVPAGASAYYFNLLDDRGLTVSSEHGTLSSP